MSNIIEKEWAYAKIYCVDDSESFAEYIDLENPYMTENTLVIDKLEPGKTYIITYYNSNKEVINVNEVKLSMNLKLVYIGRDIVIVNVIHSDVKGVMLKGKTIDYEQQLPVTGIGDQIRFTGLTRDEQYELSPINDSDKLFDTVLIKTNNLELPSAISMDSSEGFISWNVKNSFGLEVKVYQSDGISDTIVKKVDIGKNPQIIEVSKDDPNATYSLVIADNPNWTFEGTSKPDMSDVIVDPNNPLSKWKVMTTDGLLQYMNEFEWSRDINQLHIHHTWRPSHEHYDGSNGQQLQQNMYDYHVNTNEWADIAQSITLLPDGRWVLGRDFNTTPISISGWNTGSFAVEMIGDFDIGNDIFEGAQKESMMKLGAFMVNKFGLVFDNDDSYENDDIRFHRDSPTAYKTCPGTSINRVQFMTELREYIE